MTSLRTSLKVKNFYRNECELYQFYPEVYPFNLWIYVGKDVSGMVECFNNDFSYVYNSKAVTVSVPLGEEVTNSEPFSYLNGWIGRKCEEVKIGIVEDKLIWESK